MQNNSRVWTLNCCKSLAFMCVLSVFVCISVLFWTSKSSLLYIEVWKIRWKIANTKKKSRLKLVDNHQWSFAWYSCCPMNDQFQMHSLYEGTFLQAELLSLSCCRDTNRVVKEVVVQFVQLSFVNALDRTSIQCFQIPSQKPLLHSFSLLQCWTRLNPLPSLWSIKSLISWWTSASGDLASDELTSSGALILQMHFSSDASSFLFANSFALFCSLRTL